MRDLQQIKKVNIRVFDQAFTKELVKQM